MLRIMGYVQKETVFHRMDPRVRVAFWLLMLILTFIFTDPLYGGALMLALLAITISQGLHKSSSFKSFLILGAILGVALMINFGFLSSTSVQNPEYLVRPYQIAPGFVFAVEVHSLLYGINWLFRILSIMILNSILLSSTSPSDMIAATRAMKLPFSIALLTSLVSRLVTLLYDDFEMIRNAQKSRGIEFEKGNFVQKVRRTVSLFAPLIVYGMIRAQRLYIALDSSGYGSGKERTDYIRLHMKGRDFIVLLASISVLATGMFLRFYFGLGITRGAPLSY
jgi:energy-coupling factor transport system permease protein